MLSILSILFNPRIKISSQFTLIKYKVQYIFLIVLMMSNYFENIHKKKNSLVKKIEKNFFVPFLC